MDDLERSYLQLFTNAKWRSGNDGVWNDLWQPAAEVGRFKDVTEDAANIRPGPFVGVDAQSAIAKVQGPNVVKTEDVISVTMGYQYRVESLQPVSQSLLPKVGRGINQYGLAAVFN
jgi:hypothetical protein